MRSINELNLADVVDEAMTFRPEVLEACRVLARTKPWRGEWDARLTNLQDLGRSLCAAYGLEGWQVVHVGSRSGCSGASRVDRRLKRIQLTGRLSVVTVLHLFARVQGKSGLEAIRWSINLFRRTFPKSFGRCRLVCGLLVNDGRRDD